MLSHSVPINHQTAKPFRSTKMSFIGQHRHTLLAISCAFILISLLVVWQHTMVTVAHQSSKLPDAPLVPQLSPTALSPEPNSPVTSSILDNNQQRTSTELKVNNQSIPVPQNGTIHTVVPSDDGNTSVDFSTESYSVGSGQSSSQSSTSIQIDSNHQSQNASMDPE